MSKDSGRTFIIQTGPLTPPNQLLADLENLDGAELTVQRLGTSFRAGGVATFITVLTSDKQVASLAEALCQHTKRLNARGGDDLVLLLDGEIAASTEEVNFRDVRCRRQISLSQKSADEIRQVLLQGDVS